MARRTATEAIQAVRVMIASRNVALLHGKIRKTTKSALAATERQRSAASSDHPAPREPSLRARAPPSQ